MRVYGELGGQRRADGLYFFLTTHLPVRLAALRAMPAVDLGPSSAAEILVSAGSWGAALGFAPPDLPELHIAVASWAQGLGEALAAGTVGTLAAVYGDVGWVATAAIFMLPVLALPSRPLVPLTLGRRPT